MSVFVSSFVACSFTFHGALKSSKIIWSILVFDSLNDFMTSSNLNIIYIFYVLPLSAGLYWLLSQLYWINWIILFHVRWTYDVYVVVLLLFYFVIVTTAVVVTSIHPLSEHIGLTYINNNYKSFHFLYFSFLLNCSFCAHFIFTNFSRANNTCQSILSENLSFNL